MDVIDLISDGSGDDDEEYAGPTTTSTTLRRSKRQRTKTVKDEDEKTCHEKAE
eukprot:CAMPEP_0185736574 /NCGR_PEP_ID=MMETSP1171-20130828/28257_1 /TAXON_ID=374046 /ORGANISM="Helicotheca tamensis, Strain CCMP826" /LENGTH=52 /DNA_ID=CAMNT_0028407237 /DNA_START=337 /DNA_END=492 /DNA_ORIENTATION=+